MNPQMFLHGAALMLGITAAAWDAKTGRITNWLTFPGMLAGIALHTLVEGRTGAAGGLAGVIVAGLVPWLFYRGSQGRAIGGGDVKLFAALGAIEGPARGIEIELSACVVLAVFAVVRLAFEGRLLRILLQE